MALETVVYPQDQFGCWGSDYGLQEDDKTFGGILENNIEQIGMHGNWNYSSSSSVMHNIKDQWDPNSSPEDCTAMMESPVTGASTTTPASRRKRRRTKSGKNKEELENQRMTHIAVERNRRKQMNEYLAVIRSLMPSSYVQRGDQASIIGGAINFVKELEQQLQTLEVQKRAIQEQQQQPSNSNGFSPPFGYFFTFPQYSTSRSNELAESQRPALADIEVTMVESHANLKILSKKRPRQLWKIVAGFQCLWLTILHLNVTTVDQLVLYTISVKLEDGCQLTTVDEIADAINRMLGRIEEEAALS